jgi:hypothetical protein
VVQPQETTWPVAEKGSEKSSRIYLLSSDTQKRTVSFRETLDLGVSINGFCFCFAEVKMGNGTEKGDVENGSS